MNSAKSWAHSVSQDAAKRASADWYPTPPEATEALLRVEKFDGITWEPACGDGAISKVFEAADIPVLSTDLIYRGYGTGGIDFLLDSQTTVDNIVTNPPFTHAERFARHAINRSRRKVALLCRLAWLEGKARRKLFEETPLARVWVFSRRLPFKRPGWKDTGTGSMIAYAWYVWDVEHSGSPTLGWL